MLNPLQGEYWEILPLGTGLLPRWQACTLNPSLQNGTDWQCQNQSFPGNNERMKCVLFSEQHLPNNVGEMIYKVNSSLLAIH